MSDRTELQREILITAYDNPGLTQTEIANRVGCSASYVSSVLKEYDSHDAMEARIEQLGGGLDFEPVGSRSGSGSEREEFEEFALEDTPPVGVAVTGLIIAGFLLSSGDVIANRPLIRWVIILGSLGVTVGVTGLFYRRASSEGLSAGVDWILGNEGNRSKDETDSTERTPPAPQSLKDDLYFERAEKQCEWCETRVDSPDVHHITPRSEGGVNSPDNLVVLCPNCHRKADRGVISRSKLQRAIER